MYDVDMAPELPPTVEKGIEKGLHEAFVLSLFAKGIFALLETTLGLLLLYSHSFLEGIYQLIDVHLINDPDGYFATHLATLLHPTSEARIFGALYLISHGVIKLLIIVGLIMEKTWAYPASIAVFTLFIVYQVERWFQTHSIGLVILTVFDLIVIYLVWHEYQHHKVRFARK